MIRSEIEYERALDKLRLMGALVGTVASDEIDEFERRRDLIMAEVCEWVLKKPRLLPEFDPYQPQGLVRVGVSSKGRGYCVWRQVSIERSL